MEIADYVKSNTFLKWLVAVLVKWGCQIKE